MDARSDADPILGSPPGDVPLVLAVGHEFQLGTYLGAAAGVLARRDRAYTISPAAACSASTHSRKSAWS